ncbi:MAG: glycosyltransferase [bacterium]|nr:glycosyltransferase [bacterium]
MFSKQPSVAIVNDFLNQYGGGERVVGALAEIWPEAQIYTSIYDKKLMDSWLKIDPSRIHTNLIQKLPFAHYLNKHYFFLYPLAFRLQKTDADIVISVSSYAAKFARAKKGGFHIAYINTPPRFLYGYDQELTGYRHRGFDKYLEPIYRLTVPVVKNLLRLADRAAMKKIDFVIANSEEIKKRIKDKYGVPATVLYPPVETARFASVPSIKDQVSRPNKFFYLIVSRLGGYKKIDIAVKAFNKLGYPLKIIGDGPALTTLKAMAEPNIEFLGRLADSQVAAYMKDCRALIFPTEEDFGIVPVEAQAAGKAVIAFGKGGALETIVEGKTGVFFSEQTEESIIEAVRKFEKMEFDPQEAKKQAEKFSKERFKEKMKLFVKEALQAKRSKTSL